MKESLIFLLDEKLICQLGSRVAEDDEEEHCASVLFVLCEQEFIEFPGQPVPFSSFWLFLGFSAEGK